jgi:hypothetical protein
MILKNSFNTCLCLSDEEERLHTTTGWRCQDKSFEDANKDKPEADRWGFAIFYFLTTASCEWWQSVVREVKVPYGKDANGKDTYMNLFPIGNTITKSLINRVSNHFLYPGSNNDPRASVTVAVLTDRWAVLCSDDKERGHTLIIMIERFGSIACPFPTDQVEIDNVSDSHEVEGKPPMKVIVFNGKPAWESSAAKKKQMLTLIGKPNHTNTNNFSSITLSLFYRRHHL